MSTLAETAPMLREAEALESEGRPQALLSQRLYGAPITAYRFLSLARRGGDDDSFSSDLRYLY